MAMVPTQRERHESNVLRPRQTSYPPVRLTTVQMPANRPVNFFQVLRTRKWQLFGCIVLGALVGALAVWRRPYVYQARTLLELEDLNQNVLNSRDVNPKATLDNSSETYINTEAQILQSQPVFERVAKKLNDDPAGPWDPPVTAQEVARGVRVRTHETDRILEVSVDSTDPRRAAAIANSMTSEFVKQDLESRVEAGRQTSAWLAQQLDELGNKLRRSEEELRNFTTKENLLVDSSDGRVVETGLRQAQDELARAQADRIAKQAALEGLDQASDSQSTLLGDPTLQQYEVELTTLRKQLADLQAAYTDDYYKIPPLKAQIATVEHAYDQQRKAVLDQKTKDYRAAELREQMLQSRYDTQFKATANETADMVQYDALKSAVDLNRNIYSEMVQKAKSWSVASAMQTSNVRVVEAASIPEFPSRPNKPLITALTSMGFLFVGIVWALSRAANDRSIQEPGEAQYFLRSPELGVIPSANTKSNGYGYTRRRLWRPSGSRLELAAWDQNMSLIAESFRSTTASLLLPSKRLGVILVTSLNPSDGKTTVASNLAIALACSSRRVLLIDADRKRGKLHTVYQRLNERGLSDLLAADPPLNVTELIQDTPVPNLYILPRGNAMPATGDRLYSDTMASIISQCRGAYDLVIVDTPPVMLLPDARIIGRLSDGVVLVLRAGRVRSDRIVAAEQRLRRDGIPVIGTILNDWNPKADGYGGYPPRYQ